VEGAGGCSTGALQGELRVIAHDVNTHAGQHEGDWMYSLSQVKRTQDGYFLDVLFMKDNVWNHLNTPEEGYTVKYSLSTREILRVEGSFVVPLFGDQKSNVPHGFHNFQNRGGGEVRPLLGRIP
jgi:hypothetical protein